jgi:hypothetical protein
VTESISYHLLGFKLFESISGSANQSRTPKASRDLEQENQPMISGPGMVPARDQLDWQVADRASDWQVADRALPCPENLCNFLKARVYRVDAGHDHSQPENVFYFVFFSFSGKSRVAWRKRGSL